MSLLLVVTNNLMYNLHTELHVYTDYQVHQMHARNWQCVVTLVPVVTV